MYSMCGSRNLKKKEAASEARKLHLSEEQPRLRISYIHIVLSSADSGAFAAEVLCKEDFTLFLNPKPSKTTEEIPRVNKEYS